MWEDHGGDKGGSKEIITIKEDLRECTKMNIEKNEIHWVDPE